jgi:xanthine dehydrogenase/oxidase
MGKNCCKNKSILENGVSNVDHELFKAKEFIPFDPTQEPIFPPELQLNDTYEKESVLFKNLRGVTWFRPQTFQELLKFKNDFPDAKIVVGNTEIGVEVKFKKMDYFNFLSPSLISELNEIEFQEHGIKFGSAVTLGKLEEVLMNQIKKFPNHETKIYRTIVDMLFYFGGKQIRNVASIGGNVMTASPISDLNPIFLATGVE